MAMSALQRRAFDKTITDKRRMAEKIEKLKRFITAYETRKLAVSDALGKTGTKLLDDLLSEAQD